MRSKRLLIVLWTGVAVIFAGLFYLWFWFARPIGSGPAGPAVRPEAFLQPWTGRDVLLVGVGDSITAGFGARAGYSYFDRLVTNPPNEFIAMRGICLSAVLPNLRSTNLAISGSTSLEHLQIEFPKLPVVKSNVLGIVVLTTGGNDLIHNYGRTPPRDQAMYGAAYEQAKPWIEKFGKRLDAMVAKLQAHFPGGCEIFLADIFDPTDGVGDIERADLPAWPDGVKILAGYNEMIHQCAQKNPHVHLVSLHDTFRGHGIHCVQFWRKHYDLNDPHYWYYMNLEDPNERGYDAMRRLFLIEMEKVLAPAK